MIPVNDLLRGFQLYQEEYEEKALEVLRSGWYILGKEVAAFENEFAQKFQEECYCAGVDNGLDAIHLGLKAAGIQAEDEVIVQANGYIATMLGIIACGAVPVFADADESGCIDVTKIEAAVTKKTKAVIVTHLYGIPTAMDFIVDLCKEKGLLLFEDCAQSHFAAYQSRYTGMFGEAGFFSFYPTKTLGAYGDGGAVISKNKELIERIKILRNYGSDYRYHNIIPGYNARLDELQAGLLRVKLRHYDTLISNRKRIAEAYRVNISNNAVRLPEISAEVHPVWYQFTVRVKERTHFRAWMKQHGINTDIAWEIPPYLQPALAYLNYKRGDFAVTEKICGEIVSLPMMDNMTEEEIGCVIKAINTYCGM